MISSSMKAVEIYHNLPVDRSILTNDRMFTVSLLPNRAGDFVGKDFRYRPVILIGLTDIAPVAGLPPLVLEHLRIDHRLQCRLIETDGSSREGEYCVIRCIEDDSAMQMQFLRIFMSVVESLVQHPSQRQLQVALEHAIELFRLLSLPPKKTVQGLWAELLVIEKSRDPCTLVQSWHQQPGDLYDFAIGTEKIEVKSTSNLVRRHHFSLNQLTPPTGTAVIVISVLLEVCQDGLAVNDLLDAVVGRMRNHQELVNRLRQITLATLGSAWRDAANLKFNHAAATASLAYYPSSEIPSVALPLHSAVSDVHFTSDLSYAKQLNPRALRQKGPLFQCAP